MCGAPRWGSRSVSPTPQLIVGPLWRRFLLALLRWNEAGDAFASAVKVYQGVGRLELSFVETMVSWQACAMPIPVIELLPLLQPGRVQGPVHIVLTFEGF